MQGKRYEGERVVIKVKDHPLWESDTFLGDYFRSHPNVGEFPQSLGLLLETNS